MTKAELLALLASRVHKAGSQAALAAELGVSPAYIHDVLKGKREPGKGILEPLGLERIVTYRRIK